MVKPEAEDPYSVKLDMCLTDGIIKAGAGVVLGALTSVLFLRRRKWPIIGGMGMGVGLAYGNCELALNSQQECGPNVEKLGCNTS